ncbi:MAG: amino acid ABC transporter ATP-binding protein [Gemmatimonadaceae bacterium]|nr:amino acid ABC transporter ATP-binding protein [Gemmatimonadaceae bacterium]
MSTAVNTGTPLALTVDGLRTIREGREVLTGATLSVPKGQIWALMGISGAGKSTLLRSVAALEAFNDGRIVVDGTVELRPGPTPPERALRALRSRVGFVFQQHALFAHLSVLDNITLAPMHTLRQSRRDAESRAATLLDQLGVSHRAHALPGQISGGEAQRVAIARALALDPQVLLMDEPTAALDPARRSAMAESLRTLASEGRTLLITTHDVDFARSVSDCVAVLAHGAVVETGAASRVLTQPMHTATQTLLAGTPPASRS